jgi:hypothetical protein
MHPAEGNKAATVKGGPSPDRDTGGPGVRPSAARGGGDVSDLLDIDGDSPRAKGPNASEKTGDSRSVVEPGSALHGRK